MPRKQRLAKPRRAGDTLGAELLDLLLHDFPTRAEIDVMNADAPDSYDPFLEFRYSLADAARLRVQHRADLIAEAISRGLGPDHVDRVRDELDDERRLSRGER